MALSAADYLQTLQAALLKGKAWKRRADSVMTGMWQGVAQEFARIDARLADFHSESDPRTAIETLPEWVEFVGEDPCVTTAQTIAQERVAVVSKLRTTGGQSRAYFIGLAADLGYPNATIEEYEPFRAGESSAGEALWSEDDRFTWQINLPSDGAVSYFSAGESGAGEPLQSWGDERIECRLNQFKPAHTTVIFAYT